MIILEAIHITRHAQKISINVNTGNARTKRISAILPMVFN